MSEQRPDDPTNLDVEPTDAGAYIGHEPERATETIPGGVRPGDERVSAVDTESTGVGRPDRRNQREDAPEGHRQGSRATDDDVREAGLDR
ncbi:MAG: hypothetical protein ACJ77N_10310 [Chloroflexota bacterium]